MNNALNVPPRNMDELFSLLEEGLSLQDTNYLERKFLKLLVREGKVQKKGPFFLNRERGLNR